MTRSEHLEWAKKRALEYVDAGDLSQAVASMTSDLSKHSEFHGDFLATIGMIGLMEVRNGSAAVRRWVEGFN